MDYKSKYNKYKNKYLQLKSLNLKNRNLIGGNNLVIEPIKLKGISYFGHVQNDKINKSIILIGETHVDLDQLDEIAACNNSTKIIDWLNADIIPQFKDTPDKKLDIFFEWPYKTSYSDEKKEKLLPLFKEDQSTLYNLATLIMEKPENTRIHTFDFRDLFFEITIKLGRLDKIFRQNMYPNTESYIKTNHRKLFVCLDKMIQLFLMIFFNKEKTQITKEFIEQIKELIISNITEYITGLDSLFRPYYLTYPLHYGKLEEEITYMNEIFDELKRELKGFDRINFADLDVSYIDDILPNKLFIKNYNKIEPSFQSQYKIHNRKLIEIQELFSEKYKIFKESFVEHITPYTEDEEEYVRKQIMDFEENYTIHDFININNCQDLFISFMAEVIDLYSIGRILRPEFKTNIYYAGLTHTKNMFKKLYDYGFELKYETNSINRTTWENIGDFENYCIDIGKRLVI